MTYAVPTLIPEKRHEVWHESDAGDWRIAYFDVPIPDRFEATAFAERLEKAYQEAVTHWAAMLAGLNEVPVTKPMLNPGVYFCPEPDMQDHRRFYMAARVKKTKPDLYPIDTVAKVAEAADSNQDRNLRDFFAQMQGFRVGVADPKHLEAQARDNRSLPARAERQNRELRRLKERGLI